MRLQLESRQAQLLELLGQIDHILAAPSTPGIAVVGELRLASQTMLAEHFRFKEEIFGHLRGFGIVHVDRQVARCRSAMLAIQVAHRFHCSDWSAEAIARDWPGYVMQSRKLAARLGALVELDRVQLYPLIDQLLGEWIVAADAPGARALARSLAASHAA